MKKLVAKLVISTLLFGSLAGCIVRTGPRGRARSGCGPAHHWDGGRCVHNGHGHGNGKGKGKVIVRDHRD